MGQLENDPDAIRMLVAQVPVGDQVEVDLAGAEPLARGAPDNALGVLEQSEDLQRPKLRARENGRIEELGLVLHVHGTGCIHAARERDVEVCREQVYGTLKVLDAVSQVRAECYCDERHVGGLPFAERRRLDGFYRVLGRIMGIEPTTS